MSIDKKTVISGIVLAILAAGAVTASAFLGKATPADDNTIIYIDNDDTPDSVWQKTGLGWRGDLINMV